MYRLYNEDEGLSDIHFRVDENTELGSFINLCMYVCDVVSSILAELV